MKMTFTEAVDILIRPNDSLPHKTISIAQSVLSRGVLALNYSLSKRTACEKHLTTRGNKERLPSFINSLDHYCKQAVGSHSQAIIR